MTVCIEHLMRRSLCFPWRMDLGCQIMIFLWKLSHTSPLLKFSFFPIVLRSEPIFFGNFSHFLFWIFDLFLNMLFFLEPSLISLSIMLHSIFNKFCSSFLTSLLQSCYFINFGMCLHIYLLIQITPILLAQKVKLLFV